MALRTTILISLSVAGLAACTSTTPAPIDYRAGINPARAAIPARTATPPPVVASAPAARAPGPAPVINAPVSPATERPSSSPAVQEAAAMLPEMSPRPGGSLKQPRDDLARRAIEVLNGDTVYDISRRYSVNQRALIETNALQPPYMLNPGQVVYLPPPNVHVVERGETLYSVSRRYNIDTRSLALMNGLAKPWTVWPGDELLLPPLARDQGRSLTPIVAPAPSVIASPPSPPQTQIASVQASPSSSPYAPPTSRAPTLAGAPTGAPPAATPPPASTPATTGPRGPIALTPAPRATTPPQRVSVGAAGSHPFIWPVAGTLVSGFGVNANGTRNDGVDIGAAAGAEVRAAAAGDVVYAGNELSGFGNLVLLRHADGWVTAYAHAERLLVKEGDRIAQGQAIAASGAAPVHFELRKGKDPVDPMQHLPAPRG